MGEIDDMKKQDNEKKAVDDVAPKKVDDSPKKVDDGPKKADDGPLTIVLKLDLHCDGCAKKVKKAIRYFEGVESVKADSASNKLTIIGKVDPMHMKERVEHKTKKKVEIISPKPKKDAEGEKKTDDKPIEAKSNDQKPKEPQSTTVVLKIPLHCDGCIHKIKRIISKVDGVESVKLDGNTNVVTVKGTMDTKELIPYLKEKLKRNVDIVPSKKEDNGSEKNDENKTEVGGDKKEKEGTDKDGDDDKKKNDVEKVSENSEGGEKKKNDVATATSGTDEKKKSIDEAKTIDGGDGEGSKNADVINKFEYYGNNPYTYTMPMYNQNYQNQDYGVSGFSSHDYANEGYVYYGYVMEYSRGPPPPPSPMSIHNPPASEPNMFSTENPNACLIM